MPRTRRHDQNSFASYLQSRGIVWDDIEREHVSKQTGPERDSYSNAMAVSVQCTGFIESKTVGQKRIDENLSDRCMAKTRHPSARCPKHRNQVR